MEKSKTYPTIYKTKSPRSVFGYGLNTPDRGFFVLENNMPETKTKNMEIAKIIIRQLGGNKAIAMVGIYNMIAIDNGLQFNFKGSRKVNKCVIKLDWSDTYTFELWKITKKVCKKVYSLEGVYEDMLIELFESETGLYLRGIK